MIPQSPVKVKKEATRVPDKESLNVPNYTKIFVRALSHIEKWHKISMLSHSFKALSEYNLFKADMDIWNQSTVLKFLEIKTIASEKER